jgi:hypothetical protein
MKHMTLFTILALAVGISHAQARTSTAAKLPKQINGTVKEVFLGQADPLYASRVCVVFVQTKRALVGVTAGYEACTSRLVNLKTLKGMAVTVFGADLKRITSKKTLRALHNFQEASYFETSDMDDLLSQAQPVKRARTSSRNHPGYDSETQSSGVQCGTYEQLCDERHANDEIDGLDDGLTSPDYQHEGPDSLDDYRHRR